MSLLFRYGMRYCTTLRPFVKPRFIMERNLILHGIKHSRKSSPFAAGKRAAACTLYAAHAALNLQFTAVLVLRVYARLFLFADDRRRVFPMAKFNFAIYQP